MCENLLLEQLGFSIKKERKKRVADNVDRSGQMSRFPQRSTQIYLSIWLTFKSMEGVNKHWLHYITTATVFSGGILKAWEF